MEGNQENDIKLTEFDYMMISPQLQMLKAAIPYVPPAMQRMRSEEHTSELQSLYS